MTGPGRLAGRFIGLGVTGSIAAFKAVDLVRLLRAEGAEVQVLMTPSATRFVAPLTLAALSRRHVDADVLDLLPDGRIVVVTSTARAELLRNRLAAEATAVSPEVWRWLGIRAGVPHIGAATNDLFVPQTANWDLLDGVSFHKGCYTGQEIIARTQYLGRLKERMHLFHTEGPPPSPGTRIFGTVFGDQACGTVVQAAASPDGGSDLLAVVQLSALDGLLRVGTADGPVLAPLALPYPLPAAAAPNRPKL